MEVDETDADLTRDDLIKVLHAENVLARRYFFPGCHKMAPYNSYFPNSYLLLPETVKITQRVLILPTGMAITTDQISIVCAIIRTAVENAPRIKDALAT